MGRLWSLTSLRPPRYAIFSFHADVTPDVFLLTGCILLVLHYMVTWLTSVFFKLRAQKLLMWLGQVGFQLKAAVMPRTSADSAGASFPALHGRHRTMGKLAIPLLVPLLRGRDKMELRKPGHSAAVSAGDQSRRHKPRCSVLPVFLWLWCTFLVVGALRVESCF